jgi:hypothetical protein
VQKSGISLLTPAPWLKWDGAGEKRYLFLHGVTAVGGGGGEGANINQPLSKFRKARNMKKHIGSGQWAAIRGKHSGICRFFQRVRTTTWK